MANQEHVEILKQGVEVWNQWREENPYVKPDLSNAEFRESALIGVDFSEADLSGGIFWGANLMGANLKKTNLMNAELTKTNLMAAELKEANLSGAKLRCANIVGVDLSKSIIVNADLLGAIIINSDFSEATFSDCNVYGVSVWGIKIDGIKEQKNLRVTPKEEPAVYVDNLQVAQFVYLLLNNSEIGEIIDTIGKKGVLIIGRFTESRMPVLHAIRDELRTKYGLLPIMFEFDPLSKDPTLKTLSTLAHLSRFVIADLTDAKSVLQELTMILKDLPTLPVKPIIHESDNLPPMGDSFLIMQSMLKPYIYGDQNKLLSDLKSEVIDPAEACVSRFESQLAEIRSQWFPWQQK